MIGSGEPEHRGEACSSRGGRSRTVSMFVVLGTVMVLLASTFVGVSAAGGGGGGGKPKADEIGITDDEIRIAVIADVENSSSRASSRAASTP